MKGDRMARNPINRLMQSTPPASFRTPLGVWVVLAGRMMDKGEAMANPPFNLTHKTMEIKFKVGDKIKMKPYGAHSLHNHRDAVGEVLAIVKHGSWSKGEFTHYVIKWDCYKIPHHYVIVFVDDVCRLAERRES